jgi:hypothetical protein
MSVRYSTPHVHYPQLNSSQVCLSFFLYVHPRNFIIHKYWHTHKHKYKYDIWTSESLSTSKPGLNWVAGNVREEYCNGQTGGEFMKPEEKGSLRKVYMNLFLAQIFHVRWPSGQCIGSTTSLKKCCNIHVQKPPVFHKFTPPPKKMWGRIFFPGLRDRVILSSGIQDPGIPHSDFGRSEFHFF